MFIKFFRKNENNRKVKRKDESQEIEMLCNLIGLHAVYFKGVSNALDVSKPSLRFETETNDFGYESYQWYSHSTETKEMRVSIFVKDKIGELMIFNANTETSNQKTSPYCISERWEPVVTSAIEKIIEEIEIFKNIEKEESSIRSEKEKAEKEFLLTHFENKYEKELVATDIDC